MVAGADLWLYNFEIFCVSSKLHPFFTWEGGKLGLPNWQFPTNFTQWKKKLYQNSAEAAWRGETERQREREGQERQERQQKKLQERYEHKQENDLWLVKASFPISCIRPKFWFPIIFTAIAGLQKETWSAILFAPRATAEDLWRWRWRESTS